MLFILQRERHAPIGFIKPASDLPDNFGTHVGDWMRQGGDTVLTVPDGSVLDAQNINIAASVHAKTTGQYGGWLIIRPETLYGATLDFSATRFDLRSTSPHKQYRIMFAGFDVIDSCLLIDWAKYLRFWYCRFQFPILTWVDQYAALAGGYPAEDTMLSSSVLNQMVNRYATPFRLSQSHFLEWYGSDFRHIADDVIFTSQCGHEGLTWIEGCKMWDNHMHGKEYLSPDIPGSTYMHPDTYQTVAGGAVAMRDSWIGGHLQLSTEGGSLVIDIDNIWSIGSSYTAGSVSQFNPHTISGKLTNTMYVGNAQYINSSGTFQVCPLYPNSGWERFALTGTIAATISTTYGTDGSGALPVGITKNASNILTDLANSSCAYEVDLPQVSDHADNPANVWRTAHPFEDWEDFFASGRNVSDGVTTLNSPTVTSANANFVEGDEGKQIRGSNIPTRTYIGVVNAENSIGLSSSSTSNVPVNATGNATGVTLIIGNGGWL